MVDRSRVCVCHQALDGCGTIQDAPAEISRVIRSKRTTCVPLKENHAESACPSLAATEVSTAVRVMSIDLTRGGAPEANAYDAVALEVARLVARDERLSVAR